MSDRNEKLERDINSPVARKHPPKCESCNDNERKKRKDCGCSKCGGKNDPDSILSCDECQLWGMKPAPVKNDPLIRL